MNNAQRVSRNLGEAVASYLAVRRGEISAETYKSYRDALRCLTGALGARTRLSAIERGDIATWLGEMRGAPATKRLRLSAVRGFFAWCAVEDHVAKDPTLGMKGPRRAQTVPRSVSDPETILRTCDERERLVVTLMLEGGLRAGEVARLELRDIDFSSGLVHVRGKGNRERVVPLTTEAHRAVARYLGSRGVHAGALVASERGGGLSPATVTRSASRAIKRVGTESGHALRHTFAHDFLDAGGTMRELQQVLGHSSIATTQIYTGWADAAELRAHMGTRRYAS